MLRAARYIGIKPELMLDEPSFWQHKALLAEAAEGEAHEDLVNRANES